MVSCSHRCSESEEDLPEAGAISRRLGGVTNEFKSPDNTPLMISSSPETKFHLTADDMKLEKHFP